MILRTRLFLFLGHTYECLGLHVCSYDCYDLPVKGCLYKTHCGSKAPTSFFFCICLQGDFELLWRLRLSFLTLIEAIPLGKAHNCLLIHILEMKLNNTWSMTKGVLSTWIVLKKLFEQLSYYFYYFAPYHLNHFSVKANSAYKLLQGLGGRKVYWHLCLIWKDEWRRQLVSSSFTLTALRVTRVSHAVGTAGSFWKKSTWTSSECQCSFRE